MGEEFTKEVKHLRIAEPLRLAVELIPNGMIMVDRTGRMVFANSHTENIFGYDREELVGRPLEMLFPERFRDNHNVLNHGYFADPVPRAMGTGSDLLGRRKDGSEVPVEIGLTPLKTPEGIFVLSEIVEITLRKQLEGEALRLKEIEAQESERRELARELHDDLGQLLCTISINLQAAKNEYGSASPQLEENLRRVDLAIEQVRNLSLELRSPMLDDLGLVATLRWYADQQLHRAGITLHFVADSSTIHLPSDLSIACYRVVQEALANIIRHAQARRVWIEFHENQNGVWLSIRDDGIGFIPAAIPQQPTGQNSFGMLGMRERIELLGGAMRIKSPPPCGTLIEITIPQPRSPS